MSKEAPFQPKLSDLLAGYLNRQASAHAAGLATFDAGEVVPFEAGPVQPIDAQLAWQEATVAARLAGLDVKDWKAPPSWPGLVAGQEPVVAVACAVGNYPQMIRHFHSLLQAGDLTKLRPVEGRPTGTPALGDWVRQATKQVGPQSILAVGALRLAKLFDEASQVIAAQDSQVPAAWRTAWDNEKAALAWHRGRAEEASALWHRLDASVPVLFNRGMADLFLGRAAKARESLSQAVVQLPEAGAWHHLGQLYLTLAVG